VIFNILRVSLVVWATVLMASCATVPTSAPDGGIGQVGKSSSVEKLVMSRAQLRWNAIMAGDLNGAYTFISPAGRAKLQAQDYRARVNTVNFRKAVVTEAICQADSCDVKIAFDYVVGDIPLKQILSEIWILDEGNWWFVYRG
jgi:hypothetical protein